VLLQLDDAEVTLGIHSQQVYELAVGRWDLSANKHQIRRQNCNILGDDIFQL